MFRNIETKVIPKTPMFRNIDTKTTPKTPMFQNIDTKTIPKMPMFRNIETKTTPKRSMFQNMNTKTTPIRFMFRNMNIFPPNFSYQQKYFGKCTENFVFLPSDKTPTPSSPHFGAEEIIFSKERCIVKRKSVSLPRPTGEMVGR